MLLNDIVRQLEEKHGCTTGCAIWDALSGKTLACYREDMVFKSASLIKTPIMLWHLRKSKMAVWPSTAEYLFSPVTV